MANPGYYKFHWFVEYQGDTPVKVSDTIAYLETLNRNRKVWILKREIDDYEEVIIKRNKK